MKIGIIGLRPRQVTELQHRQHPVDIFFYGEKGQTAEVVERFSHDKDHVIVMAGHVARPVIGAVDKSKRHVVTGSVSAVSRLIEELLKHEELKRAPHRQDRPAKLDPAPMREVVTADTEVKDEPQTTETTATETTANGGKIARAINIQPKPERPLLSDVEIARQVPRGYESIYTLPVVPRVIIQPDLGGRTDYAPLRSLDVGQVARVKRPPGLNLVEWQARINAIRSYQARSINVALEAHFFDAHVDLLVLSKTHGMETPVKVPAAIAEVTAPPVEPTPEREVLGDPVERTDAETDEERELWKQSMIAIVSRGIVPAEAATLADAVLVEFQARYRP